MFRTLLICFSCLALIACGPGRSGGGSGDDDDGGAGLGGLDLDGDGVLTDADLSPGVGAVYLSSEGGEEEGEEGVTSDGASLTAGDGAWALRLTDVGGLALSLTLWFDDPNPQTFQLDPGTVELRSASASAEGLLVWASELSGEVTITEADEEKASGYFEGSIELTIADETETPTGEIVTIEGFAFRDVLYVLGM